MKFEELLADIERSEEFDRDDMQRAFEEGKSSALKQRDEVMRKHLAEIKTALNFACYDKTTLDRCGEVWQKLFMAENEFNHSAV